MTLHIPKGERRLHRNAVPPLAVVVQAFRFCVDRVGSRKQIFIVTRSGNLLRCALIFLLICILDRQTLAFTETPCRPLWSGTGVSFSRVLGLCTEKISLSKTFLI